MPVPAGSGSCIVTPNAVPVPGALELLTVTVKPIDCPVLTGPTGTAFLTMARSGHCTVTATGPTLAPVPLVADTSALLSYTAQLSGVVAARRCTCRLLPEVIAMGWFLRLSTWLPSAPLTTNEAGLPVVLSMTQCTGLAALPPGRLSARVTPVASPGPPLLTVTV